ncbi:MAG: hypothetical protein AB9866_21570 [Syntrophobacteraceae bacterium]
MLKLRQFAARSRVILGAVIAFMAVLGIFTFPLFILEEATQVTIWGTWQAEKSQLHILKEGIRIVEKLNGTSKGINHAGGWLHPLSFLSYRGYSESIDFWCMASKTKILALDPKLMDGEHITFLFRPESITVSQEGARLINGHIIVLQDVAPTDIVVSISGIGHWTGQHIQYDLRTKN